MHKEAQKSIWNISLKQFIKSTTRIKPEIAFHGLLLLAESNMHFLSDDEKERYTGIKSNRQKTGEYLIADVHSAIKKSF